ncbi:cdc42-interacting protein 4 homolog isoform X1 [Erpetoichthys calabaricus]|uniref:cdc42-interacting protein 4 homolog isoform X1 n=1 Tax=Erpetoichthys calabaricus TaxID=27687 RepID=UPI00109F8D03|nr:cdc42-interacting protein 4 homolog isoform X1 [Erpetoichthys calabaricus]
MDWGTDLWDQFDIIEKHTQWGLDLVEKYVKFVKERTEIEQNYAKQLRSLVKKFNPKRGTKEDQDCKYTHYQSFLDILNEMNDYAGQREVIAENMMMNICIELTKYSQDIKHERKSHLLDGRKSQQLLESSYKLLDNSKRRFEREWREAEKAGLNAERIDQDINATKADVEKAKQHANLRAHVAEECKNDYAAQLQKYNKDQNQFYFIDMPQIFNKMQDMDERRIKKLADGYRTFADIERRVIPIIGKCLDGINKAADVINEKNDTLTLIELNKSGFERPMDQEFEDYSQGINRTASDSSLGTPKTPADSRIDHRATMKNKNKLWPFSKKNKLPPPPLLPLNAYSCPSSSSLAVNGPPSPKFSRDPLSYCLNEINKTVKPRISSFRSLRRTPTNSEDFSHLPPEQRRKKLQQKIDERNKELQKELDQRDALNKMKDVYQKTPQMGDPNSLEPQIIQTMNNIERLRLEVQKYESYLLNAEGRQVNRSDTLKYNAHYNQTTTINNNNGSLEKDSPEAAHSDDSSQDNISQPIYAEFDDDFEEEESILPIGQCTAMYTFDGSSEGTISMTEAETFSVVEEDKGDGWTRVRRANGDEGYVPTSYVKITLQKK